VTPPEIESVIPSHPHIVDAAVTGMKHPADPETELSMAYVVEGTAHGNQSLVER